MWVGLRMWEDYWAVWCIFPPWLCVTLLHFSCRQSNWFSPSPVVTIFKKFPGMSDPLPEASKFQHHIKLCSKYGNFLLSSIKLNPIYWWKEPSWCLTLFLHGNPGFNLTRGSGCKWNIHCKYVGGMKPDFLCYPTVKSYIKHCFV
jgi:hypothetical protein